MGAVRPYVLLVFRWSHCVLIAYNLIICNALEPYCLTLALWTGRSTVAQNTVGTRLFKVAFARSWRRKRLLFPLSPVAVYDAAALPLIQFSEIYFVSLCCYSWHFFLQVYFWLFPDFWMFWEIDSFCFAVYLLFGDKVF